MKTLRVNHISVFWETKQILFDVNAAFQKGKTTIIVGPNGSGKSTLLHSIMGDSMYEVKGKQKSSGIFIGDKNIIDIPIDERARLGIFLSFQNPPAIAGVTITDILRASIRAVKGSLDTKIFDTRFSKATKLLDMKGELLTRSVHEGFSGGEKKKIEILTALMIEPSFALFDEIDTGVDVDALKLLGKAMKELISAGTGLVIVTHNLAITRLVSPDSVIVMKDGKIAQVGDKALLTHMLKKGFHQKSTSV